MVSIFIRCLMKFIKLNFIAFLVFAITFSVDANSSQVEAPRQILFNVDDAYEYLCKIEPDFSEMQDDLVKAYNENIKQIVMDCKNQEKKVSDRDKEKSREAIDFTGLSFEQKIANLVSLHQNAVDNKLYNINQNGNRRNMPDSDTEEEVCGYYIKIKMAEKAHFNDSLCYNGSKTSHQPGDNQIRQTFCEVCDGNAKKRKVLKAKNPARVTFSTGSVSSLQTNIHLRELLLANEVARRKIVDGIKKDEFSDLPIFYAVTMAKKLLSDQKIREEDFWVTGRQFHIFGNTVDDTFQKKCLEKVINYDWIIQKRIEERNIAILNEKGTKKTIVNWKPINEAVKNAMKPIIDEEVYKLVIDKKKKERVENIKKIIEKYNEEYNK